MTQHETSAPSLEQLLAEVQQRRLEYAEALGKNDVGMFALGGLAPSHDDAPGYLRALAQSGNTFLRLQRAKLAYEEASQRYEGALEDRRRRRSEINSWLMLAATVTITGTTILQTWRAFH